MSGDSIQEIDITNIILETANSLCTSMLESINKEVYPLLDNLIFIDKRITNDTYFEKLFGNSSTSGILMLANCLLFAFILYYCIRLITSHFSGAEVESPQKFFLRAILSAVLVNASFEICNLLIEGTNQISTFFCSLGEDILKKEISFMSLKDSLGSPTSSDFSIFSLDGILSSMLSISSFAMLTSFALRYIFIKLLILAAPFAFLCISNRSTEGFLKSWYKCLLSLLLIQIVISALLIFPHTLLKEGSNDLFNKIILIGSISALLKSNQLVKEFLGGIGITTNFQSGVAGLKSMISR